MDAQTLLGFVGLVLGGGVMMALVLELLNTERVDAKKPHRREVESAVQSVAALPAFFARPQTEAAPPPDTDFDRALIALIEEHVRTEHEMVTTFVHFPSLDSLYRQAKPSPTLH